MEIIQAVVNCKKNFFLAGNFFLRQKISLKNFFVGDDFMDRSNIEHNSQNIYYRSIVGAAEAGSTMRLGIRINTDEVVRQVLLHTWSESTGEKWSGQK